MSNDLTQWLEACCPDNPSWIHWLEGDERPNEAISDSPHMWFVHALVQTGDPERAATCLAVHVRQLLVAETSSRLGDASHFRRPAQGLHNLLLLCSEVPSPERYFEPLWALRQAVDSGAGSWTVRWRQGWDGPLDEPLDRALMRNQPDDRLNEFWLTRLRDKAKDRQEQYPSILVALRSVALMPRDPKSRNSPWAEKISEALGLFGQRLEEIFGEDSRSRTFSRHVKEILDMFPESPQLEADILIFALHQSWPAWALSRLRLFAYRETGEASLPYKVYVWRHLAECLPPNALDFEELSAQCHVELIRKLKVSAEAFELLKLVSPLFEQSRLDNPFTGPGSVLACVRDTLQGLSRIHPAKADLWEKMIDRFEATTPKEPARHGSIQERLFKLLCRTTLESHPETHSTFQASADALDEGHLSEVDQRYIDRRLGSNIPSSPVVRDWRNWAKQSYEDEVRDDFQQ